MSNPIIDPFQAAADALGGIEGIHLRCSKGRWTADDTPLDTGPNGAKIVVIVPSLATGCIRWADGRPAERRVGRVIDGFFEKPVLPDDTWNPYVEVSVVFVDNAHRGAPGTYTSSAWGGFFAITKLLRPYAMMRRYPVCSLATKERGDINGNIDAVFNITGWADPDDFPGYQAPPSLAAPPTAPALTYADYNPPPMSAAEIIDDDLPF